VGISVGEGVVGLYVGLYVGSGVGLRVLGFLDDWVGLRVGVFFGGGAVVVLDVVQCAGVLPHHPNCIYDIDEFQQEREKR
jgi:hypothetical protein